MTREEYRFQIVASLNQQAVNVLVDQLCDAKVELDKVKEELAALKQPVPEVTKAP